MDQLDQKDLASLRVAVVGLGYVGLPLFAAFGRLVPTIGFDLDEGRVSELKEGHDRNGDLDDNRVAQVSHLEIGNDPDALARANFIIVTVPTPIDRYKCPDLSCLETASQMVGAHLKPGSVVVYESTVYPGVTEEVCQPILERASGLKAGQDFGLGYSPERINPGDMQHSLEGVIKVIAAKDEATLECMARAYGLVAKAGIHRAPDIRTAEAAKVIENIQRDVNVGLMNELTLLFHHLGLDTKAVLEAARTKWNFLPFQPGLVGGHCIPVDPYYLTYKAAEIGFHPEVILAGRRVNNYMGVFVAQETLRLLVSAGKKIQGAKVLVLGATFKENVRDLRSSRVFEMLDELQKYGVMAEVYEPMVAVEQLQKKGISTLNDRFQWSGSYDAIILAVPHREFLDQDTKQYLNLLRKDDGQGVVVDVRGVLDKQTIEKAGVVYWRL